MNFKNLYFVLIAVLFAFSACSDDDDDSIVGTWTYSFQDAKGSGQTSNAAFTKAMEKYIPEEFASQDAYTVSFSKDNTYITSYEDGDWEKGSYVFKDNKLTLTPTSSSDGEDLDDRVLNVVLSGNNLVFTNDVTHEFVDSDIYIDYIFEDYPEELKDVDKNSITISKAELIITMKRK